MSPVARRAIYDDEKEVRRGDILAAARALYLERDGRFATVSEIAARAGVAKGTVYLYFQTREEIYVTQYEEWMLGLLDRVQTVCTARDGARGADAVRAISAYVAGQPGFMRLASVLNGVLEHNVSDEFLLAYKTRTGARLLEVGNAIMKAFPSLVFDDARRLLLRSYAIAVGLWQQADTPPNLRALLATHPELGYMQVDFAAELEAALALLWRDL